MSLNNDSRNRRSQYGDNYSYASNDNNLSTMAQRVFVPDYPKVHYDRKGNEYYNFYDQPLPFSGQDPVEHSLSPPEENGTLTPPTANYDENVRALPIEPGLLPGLNSSMINLQAIRSQEPVSSPFESSNGGRIFQFVEDQYHLSHPLSIKEQLEAELEAFANNILTDMVPGATMPDLRSYYHSELPPPLGYAQNQSAALLPHQQIQDHDYRMKRPEEPSHTHDSGNQIQADTPRIRLRPRPRPAQIPSQNCAEPGCKRKFRPRAPGMRFCTRHQQKYDRNHAGPPIFRILDEINSFHAAYNRVYPQLQPLNLEHDDVHSKTEDEWIAEFIQAANEPYTGGSEYEEFHSRQQKVYNGKGFDDLNVNVRMRFLYKAALTFHIGGHAVYPKGGDNEGYGNADKKMIFSERLNAIIRILEIDKRVCMDVIEGRGVTALVANPLKYEKRKTQNKDSNERKQKKQKLGDKIQEKRKARGKDFDGSDVDSEDYSGDEDDAEGDAQYTSAQNFPTPASIDQPLDADPGYDPGIIRQLAGSKRKRQACSSIAGRAETKRSKLGFEPPAAEFDFEAYRFGDHDTFQN